MEERRYVNMSSGTDTRAYINYKVITYPVAAWLRMHDSRILRGIFCFLQKLPVQYLHLIGYLFVHVEMDSATTTAIINWVL